MSNSENLTREEVAALISANEKVAAQLAVIAGQLGNIINSQEKLMTALTVKVESNAMKLGTIESRQLWMSWCVATATVIIAFLGVKGVFQAFGIKP